MAKRSQNVWRSKLVRLEPRIARLAAALAGLREPARRRDFRLPSNLRRRLRTQMRRLEEILPPAEAALRDAARKALDAGALTPPAAAAALREVLDLLSGAGTSRRLPEMTADTVIRTALGHRPFDHLDRFVDSPPNWNLRTWRFFLDWCEEVRFHTPAQAAAAANAGVRLGDRILAAREGTRDEAFNRLRIRAWGCLGSAYRAQGRYQEAEGALSVAMSSRIQDILVYADLCQRMMHLRMAQRRFAEAEFFIDAALKIYRRSGRAHREGCALRDRGVLRANAGHIRAANRDFRDALRRIDARSDLRAYGATVHNLAVGLTLDETSDEKELREVLRRSLRLNRFARGSLPNVQSLGLKGKAQLRLGDLPAAEVALGTAVYRGTEMNAAREVATVSLDLLKLYGRQERGGEAREVADDTAWAFDAVPDDHVAATLSAARRAVLGA